MTLKLFQNIDHTSRGATFTNRVHPFQSAVYGTVRQCYETFTAISLSLSHELVDCLLGCYGSAKSRACRESSRGRMTSAKSRQCQTDDVTSEDAVLIPNHAVRIYNKRSHFYTLYRCCDVDR